MEGYACEFFELTSANARKRSSEMARTIAGNWQQALLHESYAADDIKNYATAFEHEDSEKALTS
ncbi:hypothetical protein N9383_02945 [Granulosicoccus sp.]|nr:hypothetical protein [Granulosicoccus sp.]